MGNALFDLNLDSFFGLPVAPYVGVGRRLRLAGDQERPLRPRRDELPDRRRGRRQLRVPSHRRRRLQALRRAGPRLHGRVPLPRHADTKLGIDRVGGPPRADVAAGFRPENYNHSALLGVRYNFGAPRPAPVVAAQPAPPPPREIARTYLVFFDWDRADLTDRARQIIAQAATNSRTAGVTRVEVAGHADRSGTPQYNQRLSQRRAEVVAAELVRQGVNRGDIGVTAFGESRPLVPTADGVREPQNRRVEIVLR
jgi:outer membrane protein OmpA-like peptidoglycan-associated protein